MREYTATTSPATVIIAHQGQRARIALRRSRKGGVMTYLPGKPVISWGEDSGWAINITLGCQVGAAVEILYLKKERRDNQSSRRCTVWAASAAHDQMLRV